MEQFSRVKGEDVYTGHRSARLHTSVIILFILHPRPLSMAFQVLQHVSSLHTHSDCTVFWDLLACPFDTFSVLSSLCGPFPHSMMPKSELLLSKSCPKFKAQLTLNCL